MTYIDSKQEKRLKEPAPLSLAQGDTETKSPDTATWVLSGSWRAHFMLLLCTYTAGSCTVCDTKGPQPHRNLGGTRNEHDSLLEAVPQEPPVFSWARRTAERSVRLRSPAGQPRPPGRLDICMITKTPWQSHPPTQGDGSGLKINMTPSLVSK